MLPLLAVGLPAAEQSAEKIPRPAPRFVLKDLSDKEVRLSDFDGKALLVVFWATWSPPCQKQLKSLIELQQQYADKNFTVLGISLNDKGTGPVKAFAANSKINFPVVMADYNVVQDFGGVTAVPTIFLIEKNHNIIQKYVGITEKATIENDLKAVLER